MRHMTYKEENQGKTYNITTKQFNFIKFEEKNN